MRAPVPITPLSRIEHEWLLKRALEDGSIVDVKFRCVLDMPKCRLNVPIIKHIYVGMN